MTHVFKLGIVGYGFAAATFHVPLIRNVRGLELVAISSRDPAKVHAALPQVECCAMPEELFARADIDLVIIPTPNETHYPLAVKALDAGKHVVIDKPFTLDSAQARDLIFRAEQAGRLLSIFHNRRWDADFLTIQKIIASGELGRLTHFESHFDRYRPKVPNRWRDSGDAGSGLWYDLGSHLLDQTLCLFGLPQTISLDLAKQRDDARADDWFHAVLHYDNLRVILHASALVLDLGPRFVLHGTCGSFKKYGLDPQEDALKGGKQPGGKGWGYDPLPGTLTLRDGDSLVNKTYESVPGDYTRYYSGLYDAIIHGQPSPVSATESLQVMRLIELGLMSSIEDRVVPVALY
jgi:scyllo-inositol 2-dehydrogenase (NADP+)